MASVINAYSVSLGLDASNFIDGAKVTRSEMRQLTKDIEAARTPTERFAVEQDRLKRALDSGAISEEVYNRLLESKRPKIEQAASALEGYKVAVAAVAGALATGVAAGVSFVTFLRSQQNAIDDAADAAQRLGLSFNEMSSLEFAFKEGGGLNADAVQTAIKKLQINLAKAVDGDMDLRGSFARLGLDAGQLIGMGPQQAILAIADKMQNVGTHAERLKIAMELFGKSGADLASSLGAGSESLQESIEFQQRWNSLTDTQIAYVAANNDAWDRVSIVVSGIANTLAAESAPAMLLIAEKALGLSNSMGDVDKFAKDSVTNFVVMTGVLHDAARYAALIAGAANPSLMQFGSGNFTTGVEWFRQLEAKRKELIEKGNEEAAKREEQRQTLIAKEIEDKEKTRADEKEKRRMESLEREARREAELALRNAEKKFQDEVKRQEKLREQASKGPESFDVGSAGYAKLLADQANAAIANSAKAQANPTDQELLAEAKKHLEESRQQTEKMESMIAELRGVKQAVADNTIVRAR